MLIYWGTLFVNTLTVVHTNTLENRNYLKLSSISTDKYNMYIKNKWLQSMYQAGKLLNVVRAPRHT